MEILVLCNLWIRGSKNFLFVFNLYNLYFTSYFYVPFSVTGFLKLYRSLMLLYICYTKISIWSTNRCKNIFNIFCYWIYVISKIVLVCWNKSPIRTNKLYFQSIVRRNPNFVSRIISYKKVNSVPASHNMFYYSCNT